MKYAVKLLACLLLTSSAVAFDALYGWYANVSGGYSYPYYLQQLNRSNDNKVLKVEFTPALHGAIKVGYLFDIFRADFSVCYDNLKVKDISYSNNIITEKGANTTKYSGHVISYMINGYYDKLLDSPVKIVFGLGIGYGRGKLNYQTATINNFSRYYNMAMFNAMFGFRYVINHLWSIGVEYKLLTSWSDQTIGNYNYNDYRCGFKLHSIDIGITYKF